MSPRSLIENVQRDSPTVNVDETIEVALERLLESQLPALPVLDAGGKLAGIFGEREFFTALFPGYVNVLGYAGFVPAALEQALEHRAVCLRENVGDHMNTEHVDVTDGAADVQVAEVFLHHRVLIVPVTDGGRVAGIITRSDFFRALAAEALEHSD